MRENLFFENSIMTMTNKGLHFFTHQCDLNWAKGDFPDLRAYFPVPGSICLLLSIERVESIETVQCSAL